VLFNVVLLASLPLSINIELSWTRYLDRVLKFAWLGILLSYYVISPLTLRWYFFTLMLVFLKVGSEAFMGKVTGSMVWENQGVPRLHGDSRTMFGDPNALSGKTVSTMPFIWYLYPTVNKRVIRWLLIVLLVFGVNIIVFTGSRTGYVTLIAAAILSVGFAQGNKARWVMAIVVAAILAITLVPKEYQGRFMSSFTGVEAEGHSSDTRKDLFRDSLKTFTEHPLGVGMGAFALFQGQHGRNAQETHNLYTQILAETGIQGFVCFVALVWVVLRKALAIRKSFWRICQKLQISAAATPPDKLVLINSEMRDCKLLCHTTTALVIFVMVRLALGVFGHDLYEIYWWFAAGLTMALNNMLEFAEIRCAEITARSQNPTVAAVTTAKLVTFLN
jgi:O-antigen ligase